MGNKQGFEFIDMETRHKFTLEGSSDKLEKDITVIIPDNVDGAILATAKDVEDLRTKLVNGTITVRDSSTLGGKSPDEFVLKTDTSTEQTAEEILAELIPE